MKKPLMIAHRGYSRFEAENTLVSFSAAGAIKQFYGIETDVHVTNDNHFITIHDENVNRVSNNTMDLDVEKNSFAIVSSVKLADVDGSLTRYDLVIPEMIDYFKICKKYNKVAVCELKQLFNEKQMQEILNIVDSVGMLENTIFISFVVEDLFTLRKLAPSQKAQALMCEWKDEYLIPLKQYHLDVDIYHKALTKELLDRLHDNNIKVNVWTVDELEDAKKYASWGIDYITSNWIHELD